MVQHLVFLNHIKFGANMQATNVKVLKTYIVDTIYLFDLWFKLYFTALCTRVGRNW